MQTLREVLGRADERQNLKLALLCYAIVISVVVMVFLVLHFKSPSPPDTGPDRPEQGATVPQTDRVVR